MCIVSLYSCHHAIKFPCYQRCTGSRVKLMLALTVCSRCYLFVPESLDDIVDLGIERYNVYDAPM